MERADRVALLGAPQSPLLMAVAEALEERGVRAEILDLFAPLAGRPVTLRAGRRVTWEGVDLVPGCRAALVEQPTFPWPQVQDLAGVLEAGVPRGDLVRAEREGRALLASAVRILGEEMPVVNPPPAVHLAVAPALALARVEAAGLPVASWSVGPVSGTGDGLLLLDVAGRDAWHHPGPPPPGEPGLHVRWSGTAAWVHLVVGNRVAVAYRQARALPAPDPEGGEQATPGSEEEGLAVAAARTLGLPLAAVVMDPRPVPRILFVEAAPDLAAWWRVGGDLLAGAVAGLLDGYARGLRVEERK